MEFKVDRTIDARGLLCPMPTVKASFALEKMSSGQTLELLADDPVTKRDLPGWCRDVGHELLSIVEEGEAFRLFIRRGPRNPL
ncbi:MAG: sulfurtransferase TusA family protein [Elusimicrobia bacterium]|nr:sulfurtransferase TusA family protein [Elusimicrobiota bacterium]